MADTVFIVTASSTSEGNGFRLSSLPVFQPMTETSPKRKRGWTSTHPRFILQRPGIAAALGFWAWRLVRHLVALMTNSKVT